MNMRGFWAAAALLAVSAIPAKAQLSIAFVTPEMVDPDRVIIFTSLNPVTGAGSDLTVLSSNFPMMKGVELHSEIPGAPPNTFRDITSITVDFHYSGSLNPPSSMGSATPPYAAWTVTGGALPGNPTAYEFTFTENKGSAPINDNYVPGPGNPMNQSFGTLTVYGGAEELTAFQQQNPAGSILYKPGTDGGVDRTATVPEPSGALVSLGSLGLSAGIVVWRRRRRA